MSVRPAMRKVNLSTAACRTMGRSRQVSYRNSPGYLFAERGIAVAKRTGIRWAKQTRNPLTPRIKTEVKEYKVVIGVTGEVYGTALTGDELEQRLDTLLSAN